MDETCGAAYLRLLALPPLRLLTGLRSADGACVPRCLLPPSPRHPGSENNQWLSTSNSFSSSHACTSDGFPFPHVLIPVCSAEPAAFWLSSCRDPSSAPASTSLSRCLAAVSFRFRFVILWSRPLPEIQLEVENRASALVSPRGGPAAGVRLVLPDARCADARCQRS